MKKLTMIGLAAMLLASACGRSSESDAEVSLDGVISAADSEDEMANEYESTPAGSGEDGSGDALDTEDPATGPDTEDVKVEEETPVTSTTGDLPSTEPADEEAAPSVVSHPNAQVATAMTDLVGRIGASPDAIEVVSMEEVTWPDGSVGCPQPDMRYTQAIVNGTRIVLRVSGADYEYHSGGGRDVFYCKNPSDPVTGGGYGDV